MSRIVSYCLILLSVIPPFYFALFLLLLNNFLPSSHSSLLRNSLLTFIISLALYPLFLSYISLNFFYSFLPLFLSNIAFPLFFIPFPLFLFYITINFLFFLTFLLPISPFSVLHFSNLTTLELLVLWSRNQRKTSIRNFSMSPSPWNLLCTNRCMTILMLRLHLAH